MKEHKVIILGAILLISALALVYFSSNWILLLLGQVVGVIGFTLMGIIGSCKLISSSNLSLIKKFSLQTIAMSSIIGAYSLCMDIQTKAYLQSSVWWVFVNLGLSIGVILLIMTDDLETVN